MVVPGDRLKLEVKIIKRKGPIGVGEAIATVDGKIVAKGELTFALIQNLEVRIQKLEIGVGSLEVRRQRLEVRSQR